MRRLSGSQSVPLDRTSLKLLICSLGCAAAPVLLYSSYPYISSGMATMLHFTYPAIVIVSCSLFFRERLTVRQGFCCALCMAGILCFYTPGGDSGGLGIFLALSSGFAYAFYVVYLSKSGMSEHTVSPIGALAVFVYRCGSAGRLGYNRPIEFWPDGFRKGHGSFIFRSAHLCRHRCVPDGVKIYRSSERFPVVYI